VDQLKLQSNGSANASNGATTSSANAPNGATAPSAMTTVSPRSLFRMNWAVDKPIF
jgi:hypothetical protein